MKKKTFAVLGLGIFGSTIAKILVEKGYEVIAIDQNEESVSRVARIGVDAYTADFTNIESLKAVGMEDVDIGIVATGQHLEDSVMAIMNLKELGIGYILAKAKNKKFMQVLLKVGADRVIRPEREMGERIAKQLASPKIIDLYEIDDQYSILEIKAPKFFVGYSLIQLDLRKKYQINILGLRIAHTHRLNVNFSPDYVIKEDDVLVIIASNKFIKEIEGE